MNLQITEASTKVGKTFAHYLEPKRYMRERYEDWNEPKVQSHWWVAPALFSGFNNCFQPFTAV